MKRTTLAARIALLTVAVAIITALIAGALAVGLIRNAGADSARTTLARLADVAQSVTGPNATGLPQRRLHRALVGLHVHGGIIRPDGRLVTTVPLVRQAVRSSDIAAVLAGSNVSTVRTIGGATVFVEARPAGTGGVVVVQRRADAVAPNQRAIRRLLLALLIAGVVAALIGLLVARRLATPLRRTAAAARSIAGGNRDLTLPAQGPAEVVAVSDAVSSIAAALRQSEARQRDFLLSVSHDLRTPLTAIMGYAESLAGGVIGTDEAPRAGAVMLAETRRLERLVADLLDLARLDAQDFRLEITDLDVRGVAAGAADAWSARCQAAGVRLVAEIAPTPVVGRADPARLRQALDGLLENSLRVTPAGAVIVIAARQEGAAAVVEVRDAGPGLRDDDLDVAFEQGELHRRYRGERQVGTGLGLAIVHRLVTRSGGTIEAGHATEGGARFTVRLPSAG